MEPNLGSSYEYDRRFDENIEWVMALYCYDLCDGNPLAELIAQKTIPEELCPAIADIVSGKRKPNKRAASKLKNTPKEKIDAAVAVSTVLGLLDDLQYGKDFYLGLDDDGNELARGKLTESVADRRGEEPIAIIRRLNEKKKQVIEIAAKNLDISTETVENILRDLRDKIKNYPNV